MIQKAKVGAVGLIASHRRSPQLTLLHKAKAKILLPSTPTQQHKIFAHLRFDSLPITHFSFSQFWTISIFNLREVYFGLTILKKEREGERETHIFFFFLVDSS